MKLDEWIEVNMLRKSRIAKHLEITEAYLRYILKGQRHPSKELMEKIRILTKGKVRHKDFDNSV